MGRETNVIWRTLQSDANGDLIGSPNRARTSMAERHDMDDQKSALEKSSIDVRQATLERPHSGWDLGPELSVHQLQFVLAGAAKALVTNSTRFDPYKGFKFRLT